MSKKNRRHKKEGVTKGLEYMIHCPACGSYSYPLQVTDPQNEVEKNSVICGGCKVDLFPYIKAMEQWEQEQKTSVEANNEVENGQPGDS